MLSTSKVNGSIDREVRLLASCVDECATRLVALFPEAGLTVHRVPERFLLQAGKVGVTISLFRSRAGTEASAEVVLGVWDGEVTFPGRAPREGHQATQRQMQQFHIRVGDDDASWLWQDDATTDTMTSRALAMACVKTMAEQLQPDSSALTRTPLHSCSDMIHRFTAYFTLKGAWRSCDVTELGSYRTELAAMQAGQRHATEQSTQQRCRLIWKRIPVGLAAPTDFGRYDIRVESKERRV